MSDPTVKATWPPFENLGPRISLFTPPDYAPGQLVVLCTWLGAAKKHIAKYVDSYREIAPAAKILLIESTVSILTSSYASQHVAIMPAVQVIQAVLADLDQQGTPTPPNILLHTFSNGGTNSATQMLLVWKKQSKKPLPLIGILCDSGPAQGEYWKSHRAMTLSLPSGPVRFFGAYVVHIILILLAASVAAGRYDQPEELIRRTLLDESLVDTPPGHSRRICYICSKADRMVDWNDIVEHAALARSKGWKVDEVILEDTPHCNHFSSHATIYYRKMQLLWAGEDDRSAGPRSKI